MAQLPWHAFYYDSLDDSSPPVRSAIIEAVDEIEAERAATMQMGRCKRVEIARPAWAPSNPTILAMRSPRGVG